MLESQCTLPGGASTSGRHTSTLLCNLCSMSWITHTLTDVLIWWRNCRRLAIYPIMSLRSQHMHEHVIMDTGLWGPALLIGSRCRGNIIILFSVKSWSSISYLQLRNLIETIKNTHKKFSIASLISLPSFFLQINLKFSNWYWAFQDTSPIENLQIQNRNKIYFDFKDLTETYLIILLTSSSTLCLVLQEPEVWSIIAILDLLALFLCEDFCKGTFDDMYKINQKKKKHMFTKNKQTNKMY